MLLLVHGWGALWAPAQTVPTTQPAEPALEAAAVTPLNAPTTLDESIQLRSELEARLTKLAGDLSKVETGDSASATDRKLAEAMTALRETLNICMRQLDALAETLKRAAALGSPDAIAKRTAEIESYRQRTEQIGGETTHRLRYAPDSYILDKHKQIAAEYERINALADTTNKQQTNRQMALADFAQRDAEASAQLQAARTEFDAFWRSPAVEAEAAARTPTTQPAEPGGIDAIDIVARDKLYSIELRRLALLVLLADLQAEQLAAEKVVLKLDIAAADSLVPVLETYARALGDYRSRLETVVSQSETKRIADELAGATTGHQRVYWAYRKVIAEAREHFTSRIDGILGRYRESEKQDLLRDIIRDRSYYDSLSERMARCSGPEKTAAYRRLDELRGAYQQRLRDVQDRLDASQRQGENLLAAEDAVVVQLEAGNADLREAVKAIDDPQLRPEFETLVANLAAEFRPKLEATMADVKAAEASLIDRLEEAQRELIQFIKELRQTQQSFFWSYTLARDMDIFSTLRIALAEASSGRLTPKIRKAMDEVRAELTSIKRASWSIAVLVTFTGVGAGLAGRRRLLNAAGLREEQISESLNRKEISEVRFTERFRMQTSQIVGYIGPLGLPAVLLLAAIRLGSSAIGPEQALLGRGLLFLATALITRALIVCLFMTAKPRFRMIPCSNVVAQHYRSWAGSLWWLSIILLPLFIIVATLELGTQLSQAIWSLYCAGALALMIYYARNRLAVVRVAGRAFALRRPLLFGLFVRLYPLFFLALVTLLVLVVIGYVALVEYLVRNLVYTLAAAVLAALLADLLHDFVAKQMAPETPAAAPSDDSTDASIDAMIRTFESRELGLVTSAVGTVGRWAIGAGALVLILAAWGVTQATAWQILDYRLSGTEQAPRTVARFIACIVALFMAVKLSRALRAALDKRVYPAYAGLTRAAQATINSLLHYTILVVGVYVALRVVYVNLGALAVLLGGLGLGIGLGLQPLLINFVGGLILLAERHVKVGDIVQVGEELGEVVGISMRSTQVKSFDGIDLIIPNSQFVTSAVTNWTLHDWKVRGRLDVGVAYGSDVQKVRQILLDVAASEARVLPDPEPMVWFVDFAESSLKFTLACWFATPADRWFGMTDMRYAIDRRFREAGIEIPVPQRSITIRADAKLPVAVTTTDGVPTPLAGDGSTPK